jgi:hypothetical protein
VCFLNTVLVIISSTALCEPRLPLESSCTIPCPWRPSTRIVQFSTFIFLRSPSTPSFHRSLGRPTLLRPSGFHNSSGHFIVTHPLKVSCPSQPCDFNNSGDIRCLIKLILLMIISYSPLFPFIDWNIYFPFYFPFKSAGCQLISFDKRPCFTAIC